MNLEQLKELKRKLDLSSEYSNKISGFEAGLDNDNLFDAHMNNHSKLIDDLYQDTLGKVDTRMRYVLETFVENEGYIDMVDMLYEINDFYTRYASSSIMQILNKEEHNFETSELIAKQSEIRQDLFAYIEHAQEDLLLVFDNVDTKDQNMKSVRSYLGSAIDQIDRYSLAEACDTRPELNNELYWIAWNPEDYNEKGNDGLSKVVRFQFFTDASGFEVDEIEKIANLEVGQNIVIDLRRVFIQRLS